MEILRVEDLCKTYGAGETRVEAVKNVSFSMSRGEFGTVVGVSGSGKSTLLHCIGGLDTADGGKVFLNGRDIFHMKENERTIFRRRNVGFIFQSFHLVQELTVEQNIIFPLLLDYRKPEKASVEEMLEVLGLENRRHHLPGQLSGGAAAEDGYWQGFDYKAVNSSRRRAHGEFGFQKQPGCNGFTSGGV